MDALAIIMRLGQGHLLEELADALQRTADEVVKTAQPGQVTLTLKVLPLGEVGNPMVGIADVFSQRTLLATPEGRKMILEDAAKTNADLRELERAKLREQQVVDEQGIPMQASAGVEGLATPDQNGQPVVTADLSSGAMQSLGAQFGAAQATGPINNIAAAGGDASGLEMGAGGV